MPDETYDAPTNDRPTTDGQEEQSYDAGAGPEDAPAYEADGPVVVGIGASAGGVEAVQTFFSHLPDAEGMAFVVILHLPPEEESRLAEIIGQSTPLEVTQVRGEEPIEGGHVYVIPPGKNLLVRDDVLYLEPIEDERVRRAPVDHFFRSLADHYAHRMAGVILSGTGANGSVGARLIRERGGIVLVQDPLEAPYDEMPRSAIDAGVADRIATLEEMGDLLVAFRDQVGAEDVPPEEAALADDDQKAVQKILAQLRSRTGHDFSHYKRSTVLRRIARRMHVTRADTLGAYLTVLRHSGREPEDLLADLLINVTNFFRHPQAFETLERTVIPQLFEDKDATEDVRVWVPACATGEEAYSIAILLDEHMSRLAVQGAHLPDVQVLATDLSREAVETARAGRYPTSIEADVTAERLERYFRKQDEHYRVRKELREMILFAPHSLLKDPPFSRLDLVSCRNLMIYLQPDLQERILAQFHYSLRAGGYLFLGTSETAGAQSGLFTMVDKPARIYRARDVQTPHPHLPTDVGVPRHVVPMPTGPGEETRRLPQARGSDRHLPAPQDAASRHLRLRAEALRTDEYLESDLAWMDMKDNTIDVVIGPIETYEDRLLGYKAANEAFILVKDRAWSERLARYARLLPMLQEGLPVPQAYKQEQPGRNSDLNAYDAIYYAGDANAGSKTIAINLPNDERVQLQKGSRRLQLKNAMRAKFDKILVPISQVLIAEDQRSHITFDAFFGNTMFHEVAHGLGIKNVLDGTETVREALRDLSSPMEEGKADVLGLYMVDELIDAGELDADIRDHFVTFLAGIFRSIRFGSSSAHGRANMVRFNYFKEHGAFTRDPGTGTYAVDVERMDEAVDMLAERIIRLQGDGDYQVVRAFLDEYERVDPQLEEDLHRLTEAEIPVDVVFEQGMSVLEEASE